MYMYIHDGMYMYSAPREETGIVTFRYLGNFLKHEASYAHIKHQNDPQLLLVNLITGT